LRVPQSFFLVMTSECDKRAECPYCFYNVEPDRNVPARLNTADTNGLLKKLRLLNVWNIYITGGEPLLREDLEEVVGTAHGMGFNTFLLSNGRSLSTKRVHALENAGLDVFTMSLSAFEMEDRRTISVARRFEKTVLSFIFVVTAQNFRLVPEVVDMAQTLNAGLVLQPAYIPEGSKLKMQLGMPALGPFDWSELYSMLKPWATGLGYGKYLELWYDIYHGRKLKPAYCGMGPDAFVVDSDGEVYPCFHRRDLRCGNVLDEDIASVMERLSGQARETLNAKCFGEHCLSLHLGYET